MENVESLKEAINQAISCNVLIKSTTERLEERVIEYLKERFDIALKEAADQNERERIQTLYFSIVKK